MPPRIKAPTTPQNHLHQWRKFRGKTLADLADALGTTKGHLSLIERNQRTLTPDLAQLVAGELNIDVDTLWRRAPGESADMEADLLALFRGADAVQRKAILAMARTIRAMKEPAAESDHDSTGAISSTDA